MPAPVYRKISPKSIIALLRPSEISKAIQNGSITFEEKRFWKSGEEDFAESRAEAMALPVLLADASQGHGIFAWGEAASIERSGTGTRVTLRKVREVPFHPYVWSFQLLETGDSISQNDQRSYRRIFTPNFLIEPPRIFLFTWNPAEQIPVERYRDSLALFRNLSQKMEGQPEDLTNWRCYSTKQAKPGDRFYLLRQGNLPRGIVASGWIRSEPWEGDDGKPYVDVWWDAIIDPDKPLSPTHISGAETIGDNVFKSGHRQLSEAQVGLVETAWVAHCDSLGGYASNANSTSNQRGGAAQSRLTEDAASSVEGRLVESTSNRRERKRENRERCLANYDRQRPPCVVCGMNFYDEYGLIGRGFIHVHHKKPTATYNEQGEELIPAEDLAPVCPNCHAMLHIGKDAAKGEVLSIDELREIRATARQQAGRQK